MAVGALVGFGVAELLDIHRLMTIVVGMGAGFLLVERKVREQLPQ